MTGWGAEGLKEGTEDSKGGEHEVILVSSEEIAGLAGIPKRFCLRDGNFRT